MLAWNLYRYRLDIAGLNKRVSVLVPTGSHVPLLDRGGCRGTPLFQAARGCRHSQQAPDSCKWLRPSEPAPSGLGVAAAPQQSSVPVHS